MTSTRAAVWHSPKGKLIVVTCCSVVKLCPTLQPHGLQHARLFCPLLSSSSVSRSLLKFMSIESVRLSNRLIICHALLLLPLIFSRIRVFSNESALHIRWAKVSGLSLITCVTLGGKAPHHPELLSPCL